MSTPAVVLEAARERRRRFASNDVLVIACALIIGLAVFLALFGPLLAPLVKRSVQKDLERLRDRLQR